MVLPENLEHLINFTPEAQADVLQKQTDRQQLRTEYQNAVTQLQDIENATNPTNAQVIAAVKFLARTLRLILKLFARSW